MRPCACRLEPYWHKIIPEFLKSTTDLEGVLMPSNSDQAALVPRNFDETGLWLTEVRRLLHQSTQSARLEGDTENIAQKL
jgi:hypothetical protein